VNSASDSRSPLQLRADAFEMARTGRCKEAEPLLERLEALEPGDGEIQLEYGKCLAGRGAIAPARQHLTRAIELGAKPHVVYTELGRVALKTKDLQNAQYYATKAIDASEGFGPAMVLQGDIQLATGANMQAAETFDRAWQRTRSQESCRGLARAYAAMNLSSRAETQMQMCGAAQ
jgi:Tfp pilus assembly protein PilF